MKRLKLPLFAALFASSSAHAATILEQLRPTLTNYTFETDFNGASFGPLTFDVSGALFAVTNSLGTDLSLGCQASDYSGFVAGSIAFIGRGVCNFTSKVALAQAAGAIGVIIGNDVGGGGTLGMGGSDPTVLIPSYRISQDLRDALFTPAVAGTLQVRMAAGDVSPTPGVPEPASWAMMIAGFSLIGGSMRRRQVKVTAFPAIP